MMQPNYSGRSMYHQRELASDLHHLEKGTKENERPLVAPGRLSSFGSSEVLSSNTSAKRLSAQSSLKPNVSSSILRNSSSQISIPEGTIELDRETAARFAARGHSSASMPPSPPPPQASPAHPSLLLRHPEAQRLLLTGSSWGSGVTGQRLGFAPNNPTRLSAPASIAPASLFSHSALAFQELRRLVLAFLCGPDSKLFAQVDGMEITDDELDDLLVAGGSFTLYHLQHLNILNASLASFQELVKIIRFLAKKSLDSREKLFAYLNQHHTVPAFGSNGARVPERVCSLFSAPSSYPAGTAPPASAPNFQFSSNLYGHAFIPSFSWSDIDTLYLECLAGDDTLSILQEIEDSNPSMRFTHMENGLKIIQQLSGMIKDKFLSKQAARMKSKRDRYYKDELARTLEGLEDFLTNQPGSKAFAARQAAHAHAANVRSRANQDGGYGSEWGGDNASSRVQFADQDSTNAYSYLDPIVSFLSAPSTHLFSCVIPLKSNELISLLSLCYDDVDRCLFYLRSMHTAISRAMSGSNAIDGFPPQRLNDFNELKHAVYQLIVADDQAKAELFNFFNKTNMGRKILRKPPSADANSNVTTMDEIEFLYRATYNCTRLAIPPTPLISVLRHLPSQASFTSARDLASYVNTVQDQQRIQGRKRAMASDRSLTAAWLAETNILQQLLPNTSQLQLTQRYLDALLSAARSDAFDLASHPLFVSTAFPTHSGRYLNAAPTAIIFSDIVSSFAPASAFPALKTHLEALLRSKSHAAQRIDDLVEGVTLLKQNVDDRYVETMLSFLATTPGKRGATHGGAKLFLPDASKGKGPASSPENSKETMFDASSLTAGDMYFLFLLSGAGHQSLAVLQQLAFLRDMSPAAQLELQRSDLAIRANLDATNWPIQSLEELAVRMNQMYRAKFQSSINNKLPSQEEKEMDDLLMAAQETSLLTVKSYKPPVYDNVFTELQGSAYTPAADEASVARNEGLVKGVEGFTPYDRVRLFEFLKRPDCMLLRLPGGGLLTSSEESKEPIESDNISVLPPLTRSLLHSLLSAGGNSLDRTLSHLRCLESAQRRFGSFAQLRAAVEAQQQSFDNTVETLVFFARTYKGRLLLNDCLAKDAPTSKQQLQEEEKQHPSEILVAEARGILNSDDMMLSCMSSWVLSLLPRLGFNSFVLFYLKKLVGLSPPLPSDARSYVSLDDLSEGIVALHLRETDGVNLSVEVRRERSVSTLGAAEEEWLDEEPDDHAASHQLNIAPIDGGHVARTTLDSRGGEQFDHFDALAVPDNTLGYANSTDHGFESSDVAHFKAAFGDDTAAQQKQTDPLFIQMAKQREQEASEIMAYLKSGRCRLLDPREDFASTVSLEPTPLPRTAQLADATLVDLLQSKGGVGPVNLSRPRNELAKYLGLILRSVEAWRTEQKVQYGRHIRSADDEWQQNDPYILPGADQQLANLNGFNSIDGPSSMLAVPDFSPPEAPSELINPSHYQVPSYFKDFSNSTTLHLLQQLEIMETRFVSAPPPAQREEESKQDNENLSEVNSGALSSPRSPAAASALSAAVDAPNVELLANVLANRFNKAQTVHNSLFSQQAFSPSSFAASQPAAATSPIPIVSCYLEDLHVMDHPNCHWVLILPADPPPPKPEMVWSTTVPSYLIPKPQEVSYADDPIPPPPTDPKDLPPSFRKSSINLALALMKFDETLPQRLQALNSVDAPLLKLISTLQSLQPQLSLINTLLTVDMRPPPSLAAQHLENELDQFELSSIADLPFPPQAHPSFPPLLKSLLSALQPFLLNVEQFYTTTLPVYFKSVQPLLGGFSGFFTALYESLRAAQFVGVKKLSNSSAQHVLHPHIMLMLPLLQASFHLITTHMDGNVLAHLHPSLFRLEAFTRNLHALLTQLGPIVQWLNKLTGASDKELSVSMRGLRNSMNEYQRFLANLPPFLGALLPFITAMQNYLVEYIPFVSQLHSQYKQFVRPLLLPILPLLVPIAKERGTMTFVPLPSK